MDNRWKNRIHEGDCIDRLNELPADTIDLVVTSPPYNVGVQYENYTDNLKYEQYKSFIQDFFSALDSPVKQVGRVCINISLKNEDGVVDTPSLVKQAVNEVTNWNMRFEIIWNKGNSESSSAWGSWCSPSSPRPVFNHEYILVFDVSTETKQYEQTIEKEKFLKYVKSVWNIKPEFNSQHPAVFPEEIPRRLIELNSYSGDIVLDPFMGSGTTAIAAEKLDREWLGFELSNKYINVAKQRIAEETNNKYKDASLLDY